MNDVKLGTEVWGTGGRRGHETTVLQLLQQWIHYTVLYYLSTVLNWNETRTRRPF